MYAIPGPLSRRFFLVFMGVLTISSALLEISVQADSTASTLLPKVEAASVIHPQISPDIVLGLLNKGNYSELRKYLESSFAQRCSNEELAEAWAKCIANTGNISDPQIVFSSKDNQLTAFVISKSNSTTLTIIYNSSGKIAALLFNMNEVPFPFVLAVPHASLAKPQASLEAVATSSDGRYGSFVSLLGIGSILFALGGLWICLYTSRYAARLSNSGREGRRAWAAVLMTISAGIGLEYLRFKYLDSNGEYSVMLKDGIVHQYLFITAMLIGYIVWNFFPLIYRKIPNALEPEEKEKLTNLLQSITSRPSYDNVPDLPLPEVPTELLEALVSSRCLLVAGRGMTIQAGLYSLKEALTLILQQAMVENPSEVSTWEAPLSALASGQTEKLAEALKRRLGTEVFFAKLQDIYLKRPLKLRASFRHCKDLPFAGILTTCWDNCFDQTFQSRQPIELIPSSGPVFTSVLRERQFFLVKTFGDLRQPDSVSLTNYDFNLRVQENPDFANFLNSLHASRTLFFIGMGIQTLEQFASTISSKTQTERLHYALLPWQPDAGLLAEDFEKYRIKLLFYKPDDNHTQITAFLRNTVELVSQMVVPDISKKQSILQSVRLKNIGAFTSLDLHIDKGWNVFLGNNGCGKSTILKAIAVGLAGNNIDSKNSMAQSLLRRDTERGSIELTFDAVTYATHFIRRGNRVEIQTAQNTPLVSGECIAFGFPALRGVSQKKIDPSRKIPRRNTCDVEDLSPLITGSVDHRLDDLKQWVASLALKAEYANRNDTAQAGRYKQQLESFFKLLSDLSPETTAFKFFKFDIEASQVLLKTVDGVVPLEFISQGTSSIIGWVGTLLHRLYEIYSNAEKPEERQALVLIDEMDAHLHPEWQQTLVPALKKYFPNLQIIGTTHSPLIVGALHQNEVYRIARQPITYTPVLETISESPGGLRADQILTSDAFALTTTRSLKTHEMMEQYRILLGTANRTPEEEKEFQQISKEIESTVASSGTTPQERARDAEEAGYLKNQIESMPPELLATMKIESERLLAKIKGRDHEAH